MNERIWELWDQAKVDPTNEDVHHLVEKFAELIVEECANVLREESERLYKLSAEEKDELFASNFEICAEKCVDNVEALKEHFGVE
jgi:propanediol utilization protein